jgi:hypothetical protein
MGGYIHPLELKSKNPFALSFIEERTPFLLNKRPCFDRLSMSGLTSAGDEK